MRLWLLLLTTILFAKSGLTQQRIIAECTVVFTMSIDSSSTDMSLSNNLNSATKTIFIKGNSARIDVVSAAYSQSIFYEKSKGSVTILRELGSNKFITKLDSAQWLKEKQEFDSMVIVPTKQVKNILGYDCKNVRLQLKNGKVYNVFFTPNLLPSVKDVEFEFKDIPGFVLNYQVQSTDGKKINYIATKLNLSPVPASKFDVPTNGYRILNK